MRLFAVWCARQVQHLMKDPRSIAALDVAHRFAMGEASNEERAAAWDAAGDAARDAAWDAAGAAAWVAAGDAAWDAARDAAWDAARAAAWDAARDAAGDAAWVAAGYAAWDAARDAAGAGARRGMRRGCGGGCGEGCAKKQVHRNDQKQVKKHLPHRDAIMTNDNIIVHVQADKWIPGDHVWVMVPYKLWGHPKACPLGLPSRSEGDFCRR